MPVHPNAPVCSHIKVNGTRCGSPTLSGEIFCYFHQRMIRGVRTPPQSRLHPIAILEDEHSIQTALMEVVNAVVRNQIDLPRARVILRALHIAVKNSSRARFHAGIMAVTEVPEYPAPPEVKPPEPALEQAAVLRSINKPKPRWPSDYGLTNQQALEQRIPPEKIEPPRNLAEANAAVARYIEEWRASDASVATATAVVLARAAHGSE
jgi:hypothetical protein